LRLGDTKCNPEERKYAAEKLINIYLSFGNMAEEARVKAQQQYEKAPDNDIRMLLAKSLLQLKKNDEAKKLLEEVLTEDKSQIMAYAILGQICNIEKRQADNNNQVYDGKQPEEWFDLAISQNPESAKAYVVRAMWNLQLKEINKAQTDLDKAETLDLSDPTIRLELAITLLRASMFEKADIHFKQVVADDPQNISAWVNWADMIKTQIIKDPKEAEGINEKKIDIAQKGLDTLKDKRFHILP